MLITLTLTLVLALYFIFNTTFYLSYFHFCYFSRLIILNILFFFILTKIIHNFCKTYQFLDFHFHLLRELKKYDLELFRFVCFSSILVKRVLPLILRPSFQIFNWLIICLFIKIIKVATDNFIFPFFYWKDLVSPVSSLLLFFNKL
jgi:hypothetical protein